MESRIGQNERCEKREICYSSYNKFRSVKALGGCQGCNVQGKVEEN